MFKYWVDLNLSFPESASGPRNHTNHHDPAVFLVEFRVIFVNGVFRPGEIIAAVGETEPLLIFTLA